MAKKAKAKAPTKTEVLNAIADETGLSKKDVTAVLESLSSQIGQSISKRGPGIFTVPGLLKITRKEIPARAAEKHKWVPLLKEYRDIPAKPARTAVKVSPLKKLKDMV